MIALSTTWSGVGPERLATAVDRGLGAGFERFTVDGVKLDARVEVPPSIREKKVSFHGVGFAGARNVEAVTSPRDEPTLSSLNPEVRARAVGAAQTLVGVSTRLGAPHVVLGGGCMDVEGAADLARRIRKAALLDGADTEEERTALQALVDEARALVEGAQNPYLEALCRSLHHLTRQHPEHRFCLLPGLRFYELPNLAQLELVLSEVGARNLHYWHDTATCHGLEKMGFEAHQAWLETLASKAAGCYLHDFGDLESHGVPGRGEVDFRLVGFYLPQTAIGSLLVSDTFTSSDLGEALSLLEGVGLR